MMSGPFNFFRKKRKKGEADDDFFAVSGVSFTVKKGEVFGIIGKNGSGKSTLLKILSRVTPPSKGSVIIRGKVSSLLEVGTGFHPELSGRENIYLNGSILGMGRKEVDAKFADIVNFSGVEKFIDTPVKRYSSGMKMRLAFSVAAHLDSEVLLIDEVFSVGDLEFQRKCMGYMDEAVEKKDRTVILVSHNLPSIERMCKNSLLLDKGRVVACGSTPEIIGIYSSREFKDHMSSLDEIKERSGRGLFRLTQFHILNNKGEKTWEIEASSTATFVIGISVPQDLARPSDGELKVTAEIVDSSGAKIAVLATPADMIFESGGLPSRFSVRCVLESVNIVAGRYSVNLFVRHKGSLEDCLRGEVFFDIISPDSTFDSGKVSLKHTWK